MNIKQFKIMAERFVMNSSDKDIDRVEKIARENDCTMSWIYRTILFSLEKKFKNGLPKDNMIKRPRKFENSFRQTTVCFYGDKTKWMILSRVWGVELGPLIRFGLVLYYNGELLLDLQELKSIKSIKYIKNGKMINIKTSKSNRYISLYLTQLKIYFKEEFWPKNPKSNLFLMNMGIANRKYPLNL